MPYMNGSQQIISQVSRVTDSRIVFLVIDGLGGLPHPDTAKAELETASTPNLDYIASNAMCGLTVPVARGIIPGSGPGHLSLFGYDPVANLIKRGRPRSRRNRRRPHPPTTSPLAATSAPSTRTT